jgi:hypothetical protein
MWSRELHVMAFSERHQAPRRIAPARHCYLQTPFCSVLPAGHAGGFAAAAGAAAFGAGGGAGRLAAWGGGAGGRGGAGRAADGVAGGVGRATARGGGPGGVRLTTPGGRPGERPAPAGG